MSARLLALTLTVLLSSAAALADTPPTQTPPADADTAALQARIHQQELRIAQLETKVGLPTSTVAWTWFLVGMIGEGVFFMRFVVQWYASERQKRTVVPMAFWYLSLAGTALVLAYAVFVINPVFILAYSLNVFLYVRNLIIARRAPARIAGDS